MDFLHVVEQRRAVRQYRSAPIERPLIEWLISTAILAPSAMNLQPWKFAVISGVTRIDEYARRAKEHLIATSAAAPELTGMVNEPKFSMFYHAPALVLVLATSEAEQSREDCCLAAQTLMLAARNQNLGTCWIGLARPWLNLPETKAELGIPQPCHVVAPIVVGHPAEWPEPHGRRAPEIYWIDDKERQP
jgi:nitroreductase